MVVSKMAFQEEKSVRNLAEKRDTKMFKFWQSRGFKAANLVARGRRKNSAGNAIIRECSLFMVGRGCCETIRGAKSV